jgi:hypothetical protein
MNERCDEGKGYPSNLVHDRPISFFIGIRRRLVSPYSLYYLHSFSDLRAAGGEAVGAALRNLTRLRELDLMCVRLLRHSPQLPRFRVAIFTFLIFGIFLM